ncbi:MAG: asparagine--tRNA ligase, partial [Nanoarchaeota archaeon]|nr:asparagine--tRNA ligase [Nanoarchaeota archaeon]
YEDLRMIGSIPHSGFGAGMERMMAFCYNLIDVRMASLFPRDQKRVYP